MTQKHELPSRRDVGVVVLVKAVVTDPANIALLAFETNNETYDVILIPPLAIVVGPDGLDQYDYTDVATTGELVRLSRLDVVNPPSTASPDSRYTT